MSEKPKKKFTKEQQKKEIVFALTMLCGSIAHQIHQEDILLEETLDEYPLLILDIDPLHPNKKPWQDYRWAYVSPENKKKILEEYGEKE